MKRLLVASAIALSLGSAIGSAQAAPVLSSSAYAAEPNTAVLGNLAVLVTPDGQGRAQGADDVATSTNAMHLPFTDVLFDGRLIGGDNFLGNSTGSITGFGPSAVMPQPANWAMIITGFGMIGMTMRGRRRALPLRA